MPPTTTRAGRGWACRSSATARARAAPVRPAMRRQGSPSAKDFASASKAGHSLNIEPSALPYHDTWRRAGGGGPGGGSKGRPAPPPAGGAPRGGGAPPARPPPPPPGGGGAGAPPLPPP